MAPFPEKGFYRHYKHTPDGVPHNYTYEVVGIARYTEDQAFLVLYRPLYESAWMKPGDANARPLEMFIGTAEKSGVIVPRFTQVTNPNDVKILEQIRERMYPKV
jgi:hypothetical protein